MKKRQKIDDLLSQIKEKAEAILDDELVQALDMPVEEILLVCCAEVLKAEVPTIEYTSPLGQVDREKVIYSASDMDHILDMYMEEDENSN